MGYKKRIWDNFKKKWKNLRFANKDDFLKVCNLLYCNEYGHYGKKFWHKVISKSINVSSDKLDKNISGIIEKLRKREKLKLINIVSKNIQEL